MKDKFLLLVLIFSFSFVVHSLNAQEDVWYHFQEGFASTEIEGWTFSNLSSSGFDNGLYEGSSALKMKNSYVQTPLLTNSLKLSFWYRTGNKGVEGGSIFALKSTDEGQSWDTLTSIINVTETNTTYQENVCDIEELGPCIIRVETSYTGGFWVIDDMAITKEAPQIATDNVAINAINASCFSVANEKIIFEPNVYGDLIASDSIGFDESCTLSCEAFAPNATVELIKAADPLPGRRDTAIFTITSEDKSKTATYKAIIFRSLYMSKLGFPDEINNNTGSYNGWSFGGKRYPSASKGNGGIYPGEKAMRIYASSESDAGYIISPMFSKVRSLSFVAKFSKTDGETLKVQKSYDGITFSDIRTYAPGVEIPSYSTEDAADTLSTIQTIAIDDENVILRFRFVMGNSGDPRTMIDDIAVRAEFDYSSKHDVVFNVYDFDKQPIEGVLVTLGDQNATTDDMGLVTFTGLDYSNNTVYSLSKTDYIAKTDSMSISTSIQKNVMLLQEELEIFIALGQSNMAGRADIENYTDTIEGAYLLDNEESWLPAHNPMNAYSNIRKDLSQQLLGPSFSFAQTMAKYLDKKVCMIVNARGGTSISKFAEGGIYNEGLMAKVNEANKYGDVKAVIWHQGESNSSAFSTYLSKLNGLVEDMRASTQDDFYFLAGQLGPWYDKYINFNNNLESISTEISNADYVVNDSLWHRGDSTHFNTISQIVLGQRYAQKVLKQVYDKEVAVFNLIMDSGITVVCGSDVMTASGSFTPLWTTDSALSIEALEGTVFSHLTVNGDAITEATGQSSIYYTPASNDEKLTIQATFTTSSFVKDETSETLKFYPNPSTGSIYLCGGAQSYTVSLFDLSGRQILNGEYNKTLDVSSLRKGTYLIQITSGTHSMKDILILQ